MNILQNIGNLIKADFDDNNTRRVRQVLKDFGITTEIPHAVAKIAISFSKLHPIDFLQKIKEHLSNSADKVSKRTGVINRDGNVLF